MKRRIQYVVASVLVTVLLSAIPAYADGPEYDPRYDVNGDATVNVTDIIKVANYWHATAEVTQTEKIEVVPQSIYAQEDGPYVTVYGEVANGTRWPAGYVNVVAELRDADDNLVGSGDRWLEVDTLFPFSKGCFRVYLDWVPDWQNLDMNVYVGDVALGSGVRPALTILDLEMSHTSDSVEFHGNVRNDTGLPVDYARFVVTLYNDQGQVLYCTDYARVDIIDDATGIMQPNEVGAFDWGHYFSNGNGTDVTDYQLEPQGDPLLPGASYGVAAAKLEFQAERAKYRDLRWQD